MSEHDQAAMKGERPIVTGMSGSANLMNQLHERLRREGIEFHLPDAQFATAAWCVYSGGHSFNEVYSVFDGQLDGAFKSLPYAQLAERSPFVRAAVDHAHEQLLEASRQRHRGAP